MHDSERMRFGKAFACFECELGGVSDRERTALFQVRRKVAPVEILHHDERRSRFETAYVDHAGNVIASHLGRGASLSRKTRELIGVLSGPRQEELQRDALLELQVHRGDDDPHAAFAEDSFDAILAGENIALFDGHGYGSPTATTKSEGIGDRVSGFVERLGAVRQIVDVRASEQMARVGRSGRAVAAIDPLGGVALHVEDARIESLAARESGHGRKVLGSAARIAR